MILINGNEFERGILSRLILKVVENKFAGTSLSRDILCVYTSLPSDMTSKVNVEFFEKLNSFFYNRPPCI